MLSSEEYKSRLADLFHICILHMRVLDVSRGVNPCFDVIVLLQGRSDNMLTNGRLEAGMGVSQG